MNARVRYGFIVLLLLFQIFSVWIGRTGSAQNPYFTFLFLLALAPLGLLSTNLKQALETFFLATFFPALLTGVVMGVSLVTMWVSGSGVQIDRIFSMLGSFSMIWVFTILTSAPAVSVGYGLRLLFLGWRR